MAKKTNKGLIIVLVLMASFFLFITPEGEERMQETKMISEWQEDYIAVARENLVDYDSYISDTDYYDINNLIISEPADEIAISSEDSMDAIEKTLDYVYSNIAYTNEPTTHCLSRSAPEILEVGTGQCDTQSIAVISMLRKQGIAAVPVGGCIMTTNQFQAIFLQSLQSIGGAPKFEVIDSYNIDADYYSRGPDPELPVGDHLEVSQQSIFSTSFSGLHAWVLAWTPEEGWISLEATSGKIANTNNYLYHVELFPENNDKRSICLTQSTEYMRGCSLSDLNTLNKYGLGLIREVEP